MEKIRVKDVGMIHGVMEADGRLVEVAAPCRPTASMWPSMQMRGHMRCTAQA